MFNFVGEYLKKSNLEMIEVMANYKYAVLGSKCMSVQGYKDILRLTEDEIILKLKDGEISITGRDLNVKEICGESITIVGNIKKIETNA